jgi:hypothetical protein
MPIPTIAYYDFLRDPNINPIPSRTISRVDTQPWRYQGSGNEISKETHLAVSVHREQEDIVDEWDCQPRRFGSFSEPMQFLEKFLYHTSKNWLKRYQGSCKEILELGPTVVLHIQTTILHAELFFSDPTHSMNHQDKALQSVAKGLKRGTLEVIGPIILRVLQRTYDPVAEIQPEGMVELPSYSHLLTDCAFFHRTVRNVTALIFKSLGQEL